MRGVGRLDMRMYSGVGSGIPPEALEGADGSFFFEVPPGGEELLSL